MAIVQTIWLKGAKKRLGGAVLYQSAGRTLARELAADVANPRTNAQMTQRVKWANLVAFYRANRGWMRKAFESKKAYQSDYNKFMQLNVAASGIYLTKQQATQGACVVGAYRVSEGTLPSVEVAPDGENFSTNLYMAANYEGSTVAEFSASLVLNNPGLKEGDQISFIRVTQASGTESASPYIQVRTYEVILDRTNTEPLSNYMPTELFSTKQMLGQNCLIVLNNGGTGAFTFVISRTVAGKTSVSSQRLTLVNMTSMLEAYSSPAQLAAAIRSYGENTEVFLDSNSADPARVSALTYSWLTIEGAEYNLRPNDDFGYARSLAGKTLQFNFNGEVPGDVQQVWVDTTTGTYAITDFAKDGNVIAVGPVPDSASNWQGLVRKFRVQIGGVMFEFPVTPNAYEPGGMI